MSYVDVIWRVNRPSVGHIVKPAGSVGSNAMAQSPEDKRGG